MGLLTLVEDRPTPKEVYNWRVYACAAVASFASCMIGYDSAFIGTTLALPSFSHEFGWNKRPTADVTFIKENIVSVYQAGAFFGALGAYISAHYLGRQKSLWVYVVVFMVGAGIMLKAANGDLAPIYVGRVLTGIGVGGASMVVPIYISEIAPPAVRGRLVGIYELGWQIGGLCGFWINYGITETLPSNHKQWIIPFAVQLIPGGLLAVGSIWLRESPRWLFSKGKREQGLKNLLWIRNLPADNFYIVEEISFIEAALEHQKSSVGLGFFDPFKAVFTSRSLQWRLFLGTTLFIWQNGSGINAINYYSPTVFKSLGIVGSNTSFLTTGLFGVVKTIFTLIWLFFLIDKFGRRNLLLVGAIGGAVCMLILGGYLASPLVDTSAAAQAVAKPLSSGGIAAVFFFYLWTAFYTPSWNGTPWVINAEMYPQNVRSLGQAMAAASNWFWNFIIARFTGQMFANMGKSGCGVYFFFAGMMLLSVLFVWFLIPETKSVPLESMDRLFEIRPCSKANKIVMREVQEAEAEFREDAEGAGLSLEKTKIAHVEDSNV
ncbi:quinate permease [Aureobasidium namibiae CBS 147.97]|uniref:Quinate transporter n=1 Tax=Aureobasidium namibiae CBS 147.97 TaxID=1043004 RepID=A0A074WY36_9PEZI